MNPLDQVALIEILAQAQENNSKAGLTGMLLYENCEFLQILEGPQAVVQDALTRIANDTRHHDVKLIHQGFAKHRCFANWTMGFARIDPQTGSVGTDLNHFYDVIETDGAEHVNSATLRLFLTGYLVGRSTAHDHQV